MRIGGRGCIADGSRGLAGTLRFTGGSRTRGGLHPKTTTERKTHGSLRLRGQVPQPARLVGPQQFTPRARPREPPAQRHPVSHREKRRQGRPSPLSPLSGRADSKAYRAPPVGTGRGRARHGRPPGAGGGRSTRRVASCTRRPQGAGGHSGRRGRRPPRAGRCRSLPRCMSLWCHGACCVTRAPSPRVPEPRPGARPRRLTARVPEVTCSSGQPDSPQGGAPRLQEPVGQTTVYQ